MTKKTRRRFTPEYKEQAVARLSEPGVTYASLSGELGITSGQLKTWHLELLAAGSNPTISRASAPVLTLWLSMIAAVGLSSRPSRSRVRR